MSEETMLMRLRILERRVSDLFDVVQKMPRLSRLAVDAALSLKLNNHDKARQAIDELYQINTEIVDAIGVSLDRTLSDLKEVEEKVRQECGGDE